VRIEPIGFSLMSGLTGPSGKIGNKIQVINTGAIRGRG
jgi:hypothetical protein